MEWSTNEPIYVINQIFFIITNVRLILLKDFPLISLKE